LEERVAAVRGAATDDRADKENGISAANEDRNDHLRIWTSSNGRFKVRAKFQGMEDGKAKLELEHGGMVRVPLSKLSEADQQVLQEMLPAATEKSDSNQHSAERYIEQGISNCKSGNLDRAIIDLSEAIKAKPNFARAYFNRGCVWIVLGEYDLAIHDFDRTIAIDPHYPRVYAHRELAVKGKREWEP
jgi:tetratricopeptide (TPR) repeat protein